MDLSKSRCVCEIGVEIYLCEFCKIKIWEKWVECFTNISLENNEIRNGFCLDFLILDIYLSCFVIFA